MSIVNVFQFPEAVMFARTLCFAIVGISLCSVGLQAGGGGKDAKDTKDKNPCAPAWPVC
jgi:hypothetical protein